MPPSSRLIPATRRLLRGAPSTTNARRAPMTVAVRHHHATDRRLFPYKDDQGRESLRPKSQETSKSGGDDAAAANEDAAFSRDKTRPEKEKDAAGADKGKAADNPLEISPANRELSQGTSKEGKASGQDKQKRSGGGNVKK